ncbi:MAG: DUF996 domain-containing protein [Thermoprotei archaeon]
MYNDILLITMASLHDAKILGGIGSILMLFVPVVGQILVLIGIKNISDITNDRSVFDNALYALIFGIIGSIAMFAVFYALLPLIFTFALPIIVALIVGFVFYLLSAIYLRRSFDRIAELLNISYFKTAGLLYYIGAILTIILVGFIIVFVAEIFMIIAFFSIPEQPPPPPSPPPPPT